ncbi:Zn(II)2Cys6 transcription factor [Aspergillus undulatus]|uniref:Zn(II)2Cys6 transcription factor n=1 Tax=Aspergillus undulatus TaxID=1810928 RepID=UPI003CCDE3D0
MAALSAPGIPLTQPPTVKLRGSCHACALSKLKCSQDKPTCARCAKRGTTCQYLASKRAGRKQGSRAGSLKTPIKTNFQSMDVEEDDDRKDVPQTSSHLVQYALQQDRNLDTHRDNNNHHQRTPSYPESVPSLLSSAGPATSATTPLTFGHPDFDGFLASPGSLSLLDTPDVDYFPGAEVNFRDLNGFPDPSSFFPTAEPMPMLEDDPLKPPFVASSPSSQTNIPPSPSTPQSSNIGTPTQCFCFARSLALLRGLFPNPSNCTTSTTEDNDTASLPTIQQVITQNEQTIQEIDQVLRCPCSQDSYTLTVLALAVFKVLAWYGAVAQVSPVSEDDQAAEQVDRVPAIIRGYHVEGEDQGRMASQLVLGELHRVQRLVNTLFRRLKDQGSQGALLSGPSGVSLNGHASVLPFHLLDKLAVDLGLRLRGLSGAIVDRLRRG